jgi:hypothetical protein
MRRRTITAAMMVLLVLQPALFACKKTGTPAPKPGQEAHKEAMLKKSFEESKKVTAATVNGEPITMYSVLREMNAIGPQYLKPGQQATPEITASIRKDALNTLIIQALAVQQARERGLKVKPEAIDAEIKKIRDEKGSDAGYQEYLVNNGLTEDELRKIIEQDHLFELIAAQEVDAKIHVTDAALRARYKREKAGLKDTAHRQMTFQEAKGMLELKVKADAAEMRMREWEKELRKNARIEVPGQQKKP